MLKQENSAGSVPNIEWAEAVRKTWRCTYARRHITRRRNKNLMVKSKKHKEADYSRQCLMTPGYTEAHFILLQYSCLMANLIATSLLNI